jgi:hypothetical protein
MTTSFSTDIVTPYISYVLPKSKVAIFVHPALLR